MRLDVEANPAAEVRELIDRGLDVYNEAKGGPLHASNFWVIARDDDGGVQAGLKAHCYFGWMFVDWLWVSPDVRGGGVGSSLLMAAETEARSRGCIGAHLQTYSFQAPDFYAKHGYQRFGQIDDYPPGHSCIWLKKRF
ncbi:GNAT family N-acetyltransferase [Ancylobacter sp. WKF20]|uniref:GNAT family N-acetyltransferase n=1 Tax=Ancylobacter sp. WKF20 TaxID=3039801 RepID=UPI002434389A|nr:GNAT family N-acetyltransferase [Ancylobacter sp. WKF20]WGD31930.1 GNAT family N-acetyltransferase [Ancylobacter sp. WKF20]